MSGYIGEASLFAVKAGTRKVITRDIRNNCTSIKIIVNVSSVF